MNNTSYYVIALMSGTSLDGVDIAYIHYSHDATWHFSIIQAQTIAYSIQWKNKLKQAIHARDIDILDLEYTHLLAAIITDFITTHGIKTITAICSHGHTVFHEPQKGLTKQIGNLPLLANLTGHQVVCDFRVQDVAMGGQGAPLVPIGDQLLFSSYDYCLNLGGFANISYQVSGQRVAYDICPVNVVLNHYAVQLGSEYDRDGAFAKAGIKQAHVLQQLNALEFYNLQPPKSLGVEWVEKEVFPILKSIKDPINALATYTQHVAQQICRQVGDNSTVLVTGGGAKNSYLMQLLDQGSNTQWIVPDDRIVDYKEALIFGLLGVLRLRNEVNCLKSVTGATQDHSSGQIFTV